MVVVDNTFLSLLLHPNARPPRDPSTGFPVERVADRIDVLIGALEEDGETIIVPTPVLTEFLILADKDGPKYLADLNSKRTFQVVSFDQKAAIELAAIHLASRASKKADKRAGAEGTWAKINFDRQIVAIAKANNAHTIYSDDEDVEKFAKRCDIDVVRTWELPLPQPTQNSLLSMLEESEPSPTVLLGEVPAPHGTNTAVALSPKEESEEEGK
jgi:predicted nucleic acid-binding protein